MAEPSLEREYRSYYQVNDKLRFVAEQWPVGSRIPSSSGDQRVYRFLRFVYVAIPIIIGLDKFFFFLTDWSRYLPSSIPRLLAIRPQVILALLGILEIFLGIGLAFRPGLFANLLAFWFAAAAASLFLQGLYLDIALQELGLAAGLLAYSRFFRIWQ